MTRYNDKNPVRPAALRSYADSLEKIAVTNRALAKMMESDKIAEVQATHVKTAKEGLVKLSRFLGAVMEAYTANVGSSGMAALLEDAGISQPETSPESPPPDPQDLSRPLSPSEQAAAEDTATVVSVASGMKMEGKKAKKSSKGERK